MSTCTQLAVHARLLRTVPRRLSDWLPFELLLLLIQQLLLLLLLALPLLEATVRVNRWPSAAHPRPNGETKTGRLPNQHSCTCAGVHL
jgi:hypothetical protein